MPCLSVHLGDFQSHPTRRPLADSAPDAPTFVTVIRTEEKGSDVNLASYLLVDGFKREYEMAVVVSNDSDLAEPIRLVRCELGLPVTVVNPHLDSPHPSYQLQKCASKCMNLWPGSLQACQFPPTLRDAHGVIHKPAGW